MPINRIFILSGQSYSYPKIKNNFTIILILVIKPTIYIIKAPLSCKLKKSHG
jgi:hypothetical protein